MTSDQSYAKWIEENVGNNVGPNSRFVLRLSSQGEQGSKSFDFEFDLVWFILLYAKADDAIKIQVVKSLLQDQLYLAPFQNTAYNPLVKRMLEEFLLFNYAFLDTLKSYLDFTKLDVPLDFISHALFIKRSVGEENKQINEERLKIINTILGTGFKLTDSAQVKDRGAAVQKVLLMDGVVDRFKVADRMLQAGFKLFTDNIVANTETLLLLVDERSNPYCLEILKRSNEAIKNLRMHITDTDTGNISDYYYWVKEDMDAVHFLKTTLGVNISPTTKNT